MNLRLNMCPSNISRIKRPMVFVNFCTKFCNSENYSRPKSYQLKWRVQLYIMVHLNNWEKPACRTPKNWNTFFNEIIIGKTAHQRQHFSTFTRCSTKLSRISIVRCWMVQVLGPLNRPQEVQPTTFKLQLRYILGAEWVNLPRTTGFRYNTWNLNIWYL